MLTNRLYMYFVTFVIGASLAACAAPASPTATSLPTSPLVSTDTAIPAIQPTAVKAVPHVPLAPGIYISTEFKPLLTYTVPDGWKMFEDDSGQFGLALLENDGPCLCIWRDVRAAARSCAEEPEPGVGSSAADIVNWLATRDGLETTQPKPVSIGGLNGYLIDVR